MPAVGPLYNSTDFEALANGYATFLFALGGVGITILTLVLALKHGNDGATLWANLIASLLVFTLSCFVGGHLMTETAALQEFSNSIPEAEIIQRFFVISEANVFTAASLFLFTLIVLPLTYETEITKPIRGLLGLIWFGFTVNIYFWLDKTIVFLNTDVDRLRGTTALVTAVLLIGGLLLSRRSKFTVLAFACPVLSVLITELWFGNTMTEIARYTAKDVWIMAICAWLSTGPIFGTGYGLLFSLRASTRTDSTTPLNATLLEGGPRTAMSIEDQHTDLQSLRAGVGDSFNIYQATIAMIAIFLGFVFTGLLTILLSPEQKLTLGRLVVLGVLASAMIAFALALLLFHATAHRVCRYWGIPYPISVFNKWGSIVLSGGLLLMFLSVAVLFWERGLLWGAYPTAVAGFGVVALAWAFRRMHAGWPHLIDVDEDPPFSKRASK